MKDILNDIRNANLRDSETWIQEARFGLRELEEHLLPLNQGSNILEIGCGSGILLSLISQNYPSHKLSGIEPFQGGFEYLKDIRKILDDVVEIHPIGYEQYKPSQKFELIYLVNVFEYLDDFQDFINTALSWLAPNGKLIILGSNFAFPFEFHFRVPIVINKKYTLKIFKKLIKKRENEYGTMWDDLNFISKNKLLEFLKQNHYLQYEDDIEINFRMIDRLSKDKEFAKRQTIIGCFARSLSLFGLINIVRLLPSYLPYMKIIITRRLNSNLEY